MTPLIINNQPREKSVAKDTLDVVRVWDTIQGEGPFAGRPAIFVRLAGCNLECPACDTDYTNLRREVSVTELMTVILRLRAPFNRNFFKDPAHLLERHDTNLVVLTGGEPFRQEIGAFAREILAAGYDLQIETNGTMFVEEFPWSAPSLMVVCSPKTPVVNQKLRPYIKALKYVVAAGAVDSDGLPFSTLGNSCVVAKPWAGFLGEIFISPEDSQDPEQNKRNVRAAVESCLRFRYRLSMQMHKVIGVD